MNKISTIKTTALFLMIMGWSFSSFSQEYRTITGVNNNLQNPTWGSVGMNLQQVTTNGFADGVYLPGGANRPNPRQISNMLFMQNQVVDDLSKRTAFNWAWGQLIDHDLSLVRDHPAETLPVVVPIGDAYFDPYATGLAVIPVPRSQYDPSSGTGPGNPRQYPNDITAYIDASFVYGSEAQWASWLRTFEGGKLKTSAGNMLPFNTTSGEYDAPLDPNAPHLDFPLPFPPNPKLFVGGDFRTNENPILTVMHTLFVREHNLICDELAAQHPNWTDHQLYHQARKILGAKVQAIHYEEWLPSLGIILDPYQGYNPAVNPQVFNEFSAAAYRMGHTMLTGIMPRLDENMNTIPEGDLMLRHAFFNIDAVRLIGIEPYLRGFSELQNQGVDCKVVDDVRHFLFGGAGSIGRDLVAVNIQRGRERGLADYNTIRADFGLDPVASFYEITADPLMALSLQDVYGNVNDMDLWVGLLAEDHMEDAVFGPSMTAILKAQFEALRDGDRFYYENDPWLTPEEKEQIRNTRFADIVRRNTSFSAVQDDIFFMPEINTATTERIKYPTVGLNVGPNPTRGECTATLTVAENTPVTLQLVDMRGVVLWEQKQELFAGDNTVQLNLDSRFPSAQYYFLVKTGYHTANYKILLKLN
ncbi:MAG: peroxidase family protein [Saprospiraceae bacterium]|jgi:peroxidase